ncbi:NAD-dependent epimerase/dehydratase family protein [Maribellus mangrovi]|uniref:NAD-dependent epimerase/dehydratase family protein n=1 Tax=Maribellus mangrovi TaxID=3133146 RepID=UPI0030EF0303
MLKVAVTGASGHIGNCLVRELIKKDAEVKVLVHKSEYELADPGIEVFYGDILDPESLESFCKGVDVVYHCAALISIDNRRRRLVFETNVTGTKNMLEAAIKAGVKKFVHFSSIDAFQIDKTGEVITEESPLTEEKDSIYNFSKAKAEGLVMEAVLKGLNAVILSPTAVLGPYDSRGSYLGQALIKLYKNKFPALIPGGYNWVDVRDVVDAAIQSVDSGRSGERYILSGHFCTIKDLSVLIGKMSGNKPPRFVVSDYIVRLICPFYQLYYLVTNAKPMFTCLSLKLLLSAPSNISCEKARDELGYNSRELEESLRDTFEWYKQNDYIN